MPSKRSHKKLNKPWHARAKRDDLEYSLGYYATYEEAVKEEKNLQSGTKMSMIMVNQCVSVE